MNDPIIDDVLKSDRYSVSINQLMFGRSYKPNVVSVSRLLDDNGYFGRYRIEVVKDKKFGIDTLIKIHIYLVDSGLTYTWPHDTFFDLDKKKFGHNRKVPRGVFSDKFMFGYCFRVLSVMFTPMDMLPKPLSMYDTYCILCMKAIDKNKHSPEDWPWIISKTHGSFGQRPYYEKVIPFLSRLGLIINNKFKIIGKDDAIEYPSNLFDIDYWHNL